MAISVLDDEDVTAVGRSADAVKLDGKSLYYTVRVFGIEWLTKSGKNWFSLGSPYKKFPPAFFRERAGDRSRSQGYARGSCGIRRIVSGAVSRETSLPVSGTSRRTTPGSS
jgi:hypothetical protein